MAEPKQRVALVDGGGSTTNAEIAAAWRSAGIDASAISVFEAVDRLRPGELAVGRIDVRRSLDGIEAGLLGLLELKRRGVIVFNGPAALLAAHDKLRTSRLLLRAGLPHPRGTQVRPGDPLQPPVLPAVIKPRFGSWGADVFRCDTADSYRETIALIADRSWFRHQGALVQPFVPATGRDLRVLVARGEIVGAVQRVAREGEWRTNFALGGRRVEVVPPPEACLLAAAAAAAVGIDFGGVDLLPLADGSGYVVLEVNGAVDFSACYSQPGRDVYLDLARALHVLAREVTTTA